MTVLLTESFNFYNGVGTTVGLQAGGWQSLNWFYNPQMASGRFGGQGLQNGGGEGCVSGLTVPALSGPGYGVCNAIVIANLTSVNNTNTGGLIGIAGASITTEQFTWRPRPDGSICVYRAGTLLYQTAAGILKNNVFHYVECYGTLSTTVGTVNIKVDGVQVVSLTGVNNCASGATSFSGMNFGGGMFGSSGGFPGYNVTIDDLYMTDGNTYGEVKMETPSLTGDTATKMFVPDTGTVNYSRVNAAQAQSSTFVQGSNVGDTDLYTIGALVSVPAQIPAVRIVTFGQKTDAAARQIAHVADVSGVQTVGPNVIMPATEAQQSTIMLTKPGGGAWTGTDIAALKIGMKVTV